MKEDWKNDWDGARYAREKHDFIESRLRFRSVYFHASLIFAVTWLVGWLSSFLLLKSGVTLMAGRYAVSFLVSYLVFLGAVRIWADFMRHDERTSGSAGDGFGSFDVPSFGDGEGCVAVLAVLVLGLVIAGLFAMTGGLPMLLEVAFEVVFAGTIVRRMSRREMIGDWSSRLVSKTRLPALTSFVVLVGSAAWLQARVPGNQTFAEALRILFKI
ncbi:MAG: hypothetical protein H7228_03490 [Polaromonas sp.]|nr:hypothetical protein [Polaromonas sp.]